MTQGMSKAVAETLVEFGAEVKDDAPLKLEERVDVSINDGTPDYRIHRMTYINVADMTTTSTPWMYAENLEA